MFSLKKYISNHIQNNKNNISNFLPISTVLINSDGTLKYVSIISNKNFERQVVISDMNGNIMQVLLELGIEDAKIVNDNNYFYIITYNAKTPKAYKFSCDNFNLELCNNLGSSNIQNISINENNLFLYDSNNGILYQTNKDFELIDTIDFKTYKEKSIQWTSQHISATKTGYISISAHSTEQDYLIMKEWISKNIGKNFTKLNDSVSSISFDRSNNILYVAFYDIILIIKNNICNSFIHLRDLGIVSLNYCEEIDSLLVCCSNVKKNDLTGKIIRLDKSKIDTLKIPIESFDFSKNTITSETQLSIGTKK